MLNLAAGALGLAALVCFVILSTGAFGPHSGFHEVGWLPLSAERALELPGVWPSYSVPVRDSFHGLFGGHVGLTGRVLTAGFGLVVAYVATFRKEVSFERVSIVSAALALFAFACTTAAFHEVLYSTEWYEPPFSPWRSFPTELRLPVALLSLAAVGGLVGAARAWRHPTTSASIGLSTATGALLGLWATVFVFATLGAALPQSHPPLPNLPASINGFPWQAVGIPHARFTASVDGTWRASIRPPHERFEGGDQLGPETWPTRTDRALAMKDLADAVTGARARMHPEEEGLVRVLLAAQADVTFDDLREVIGSMHSDPNVLLIVETAPRRVGTVPFALHWHPSDDRDGREAIRLVRNDDPTKPPHALVGGVAYANAGDAVRARGDALERATLSVAPGLRWADVLHALDALPTEDVELSVD